ncbi:Type IV pili methyl-accepting chemotaxis transducer N-term [Candidatus Electrothrix aarhusensis]
MKFGIIKILKILIAAFICALCFTPAFAAEKNHDLFMLEAAKNIEFLSQRVAKGYFYRRLGIRPDRAAEDLKKSLVLLQKDMIILQAGIENDKEEQDISVFLEYTMSELKSIIENPYSKKNGALMIDYSESLLEGAEFIVERHKHKNKSEEVMLVAVEHSLFLLERINKFYIAYQAGFKDYNNVVQLKQAVQDFEITLAKINVYTKYSDTTLVSRSKINEFWPVAKEFFIDIQKGALPVIVLASVEKLEKELTVLENFHHNNARSDKS